MTTRYFTLSTIKPSLKNILGRLGYNKKKTRLDERSLELIKSELDNSLQFIKPEGLSRDCSVFLPDQETVNAGGIVFHSKKLALIMKNSSSATIFACTIGSKITDEIAGLSEKGEMSRAVILDSIASESVEALAEYINGLLAREKVLLSLWPSKRFSPGYGDLKTNSQPTILRLLEAKRIGLSCSRDSFTLVPEKSITAIIGWNSYAAPLT